MIDKLISDDHQSSNSDKCLYDKVQQMQLKIKRITVTVINIDHKGYLSTIIKRSFKNKFTDKNNEMLCKNQ